jgi:hypothetical protein
MTVSAHTVYKVLVCGDRRWSDKASIRRELEKLPKNTTIIQGGCRGADQLAAEVAEELGFTIQEFPAKWSEFGLAAGPIRNREMVDQKPDMILAFHSNLSESKGTRNMIGLALANKIPSKLFDR